MATRRDPGHLPARAAAMLGALVVVATVAAAPVSPGPSTTASVSIASPAASAQPSPTPAPTPRPKPTPGAPATAPSTTTVRPMLVPVLAAPAVASFADGHFVDAPVFTGLTNPTTVRFASDGRAFVAEKGGAIKEFDSLADTAPTVVTDLSGIVDNYWDRGLLSIAIDPGFLSGSAFLYAYVVYDAPAGGTAPTWNDACPTPPGGTTDGCVVTSELLRITVNPLTNLAAGPPTVLIHDWCQQFPSHSGGAMAFDASGKLLVTGGDGASFSGKDYGQRGGTLPNPASPVTPVNPCGDPTVLLAPNPDGTPVTEVPTAEGGALRSQDIRTSGDPTGLAGTLIRVDPATGDGAATNPLAGNADANDARIVAHGFRNPFRMTIRPGTNEVYVGDVGDQTWEEIDKVVPTSGPLTTTTLPNFGWPCYEGTPQSGWQSLGINMCTSLYAQANAVTSPLYGYSHTNALSPTGPCFVGDVNGRMSSSVSGLAFYEGASGASIAYPAKYNGALFFADYSRNCLGVLLRKPDGTPDPAKMETVATGLAHPVDLLTGAGGDLYYVDLDGGRVMRISYHTDPVARATATPSVAHAPVVVHLDGSTSVDPDPNDSIASYHWDLNHNGIFDEPADATGVTFDWAIAAPAVYTITLKVVTVHSQSASADIVIDATNDPPVPSIDLPASPLPTWAVGETINFGGSATDREDGTIDPSQLSWELVMVHCPAGCHNHFIQSWNGVASGSFVAPDHEYPSHLELRLTATDSHGSRTTTAVELQPKTSTLTVTSSLPSVALTIDGAPAPSPTTITVLRGGTVTVAAPLVVSSGGKRYRFSRWTDNSAAVHDVVIPGDTSLTATYVADAPETCASATTTSASGAWVADRTSGNGDQDWFRFTLPSKHRVIVTAGSLPVDAMMELWSSCGKRLAVSDAGGTHYEQLTRVLAAGTYRVHVVAKGGARSDLPYAVLFRPMSSGLPVVSSHVTASGGHVRIAGEVMANTGATRGRVTVTATFRNGAGKVVGILHGPGFAARLGDGARTSFVITGTMGAYASVRLTVTGVAAVTVPSVSITSLVATAGPGGTATETGSVKNRGSSTARSVTVARTWYGTRGEVLAVGWATVSPSTLAKGASGTFTVHRPALPTYNGSSSQVRAIF